MHTREFFYDNYKNHPEPVLKRIAGEYSKLTAEAQEALRDVLRERKLENLLSEVEVQEQKKNSLAHLTADEVRILINKRLEQGENLEIIKMDLRSQGVNIYKMSLEESRSEENIDRRFMELQAEGKSKAEIEHALKEEFKIDKETSTKIPERLRATGAGLLVAGGVCLLIGVPMTAVVLQSKMRPDFKFPAFLVVAGIILLSWGIKKRAAAAKFISDSEADT